MGSACSPVLRNLDPRYLHGLFKAAGVSFEATGRLMLQETGAVICLEIQGGGKRATFPKKPRNVGHRAEMKSAVVELRGSARRPGHPSPPQSYCFVSVAISHPKVHVSLIFISPPRRPTKSPRSSVTANFCLDCSPKNLAMTRMKDRPGGYRRQCHESSSIGSPTSRWAEN